MVRIDRAEYREGVEGLEAPPAGFVYLVLNVGLRNTYSIGPHTGPPVPYRADQFSAEAAPSGALRPVTPPAATGLPAEGRVTTPLQGQLVFLVPAGATAVTVRFTITGYDIDTGYVWPLPGPAVGTPVLARPSPTPPPTWAGTPRVAPTSAPLPPPPGTP
jgi:hypothetical protein